MNHSSTASLAAPRIWGICLVMIASFAGIARADRPHVFGMGHYLAAWAGQPWSYDSDVMDKMNEMGATAVWLDFPWAGMESTEGSYYWAYASAS